MNVSIDIILYKLLWWIVDFGDLWLGANWDITTVLGWRFTSAEP